MGSYEINKIKQSYKISDYLEDQGISPLKEQGDHKLYRCPLPHHPGDNDPSFYIYNKGNHEDFYCYGCKSGGSIIHFIADYEKIGLRKAIQRLSAELNIDIEEILDAAVEEARQSLRGEHTVTPDEALTRSLYIAALVHDLLTKVDKSPEEAKLCEQIFQLVDKYVYAENVAELDNIIEVLPDKLGTRYKLWSERQEMEKASIAEG